MNRVHRIQPRGFALLVLAPLCGLLGSCAHTPAADPAPTIEIEAVELLPGVRVDRARRIVEFDGFVPIDAFDPDAPDVWLEQIVCTPDTREHESLVVTTVRPSHVHAALLSIGLRSGSPGSWRVENNAEEDAERWRVVLEPPSGDSVVVEFLTRGPDGTPRIDRAESWVVSAQSGRPLGEDPDAREDTAARFVFAGSRVVSWQGRGVYDADFAGTLIGLVTFGGETIGLSRVIPDAELVEPLQWKANPERVPRVGTAVTVRLSPG